MAEAFSLANLKVVREVSTTATVPALALEPGTSWPGFDSPSMHGVGSADTSDAPGQSTPSCAGCQRCSLVASGKRPDAAAFGATGGGSRRSVAADGGYSRQLQRCIELTDGIGAVRRRRPHSGAELAVVALPCRGADNARHAASADASSATNDSELGIMAIAQLHGADGALW